ncbi:unnamed protein product, partial [Staurois parvus]
MVGVTGQVQQVASSIVQRSDRGMVRVTSQGSEQVASSVDQSRRVSKGTETGCRKIQGQDKHNTQGRVCKSG